MLQTFLNNIIIKDGFLLETSDKKNFIIGKPLKKKSSKIKIKK